jgi:integrase
MKYGSVYQRHSDHCPRDASGQLQPHRCRGPWAYALEYGRDTGGKRIQTTKSGFPTKGAAKAALAERVAVLMTGVNAHELTVGAYLDTWLQGKHGLKPSTKENYRAAVELYIRPHLGSIRLVDLRPHHLDRFYAAITVGRRGKPLSAASIRRIHATLRSALAMAVRRRLIPWNPALHIELAPEKPRRPTPWTADQCRHFLEASSDDRLNTLYYLLIVTGMRRGEAIGLKWSRVDLDRQYLAIVEQAVDVRGTTVIGTPKTSRGSRVIPLDGLTVMVLREHRQRQEAEREQWGEGWVSSGLVFTREDGSILKPEFVSKHFKVLSRRAGLPEVRLHDLRHTNASLALEAGVELKVVSERLGHATTGITADLYTHVAPTVGQSAAARIADVLRGPSQTPGSDNSGAFPSGFLADESDDDSEGRDSDA